jgi:hypothetical protein
MAPVPEPATKNETVAASANRLNFTVGAFILVSFVELLNCRSKAELTRLPGLTTF